MAVSPWPARIAGKCGRGEMVDARDLSGMRAWRNGRRNGLEDLSALAGNPDVELLKFGEPCQMAIPSQARREGVETRRAAPKAQRYGEGIVQTTNAKGRRRKP